jgi:SAM-dependent methyltransferase
MTRGGRVFAHAEARGFYSRLGSWLDTQAFYENLAVSCLLDRSRFDAARSVFEFGCGTGRVAARLLESALPQQSSYTAVDVSPVMVKLTLERLRPWAGRVDVRLTDGSPAFPDEAGSYDRFLSTYVLDLLSDEDTRRLLAEARRLLSGGGLLCVASLSCQATGVARMVAKLWARLHALSPSLVGGCRPVDLPGCLPTRDWRIECCETVTSFGIASDAVVASRVAREDS